MIYLKVQLDLALYNTCPMAKNVSGMRQWFDAEEWRISSAEKIKKEVK